MKHARALLLVSIAMLVPCSTAASAQEQEDESARFSRIKGGAVYDHKYGVDGTAVSEEYLLTHVVCSDGARSLRVMLPVAPEDDGTVFSSTGPKSTLVRSGTEYRVTFRVSGTDIVKRLELKPVNDPKSHYRAQFMLRLDHGDALWKALTSGKDDAAAMLIGQGGMPVSIPTGPKLDAALATCGLRH